GEVRAGVAHVQSVCNRHNNCRHPYSSIPHSGERGRVAHSVIVWPDETRDPDMAMRIRPWSWRPAPTGNVYCTHLNRRFPDNLGDGRDDLILACCRWPEASDTWLRTKDREHVHHPAFAG